MIIEIEDKKGNPWITFTADNPGDWERLEKLRDDIFGFDSDECFAQYQVPMDFDQKARQVSIMLDTHDMDEEIQNIKNGE